MNMKFLPRLPGWSALALLAIAAGGCGGGDDDPNDAQGPQIVNIGSVTLPANSASADLQINVPSGAASLMLVADGGAAPAVIVYTLQDPDGQTMVTESFDDVDPMGRNTFVQLQSIATGLIPHSPSYNIKPGKYTFSVASVNDSGANVQVKGVINRRSNLTSGVLDVNLLFCGIPDLNASNALNNAKFMVMFNEFKRVYQKAGITIGDVTTTDCSAANAPRLTSISDRDQNENGKFDELEELFTLSSGFSNKNAMNFFFVQEIAPTFGGILGISGGIPGPPFAGTSESGTAVATFGQIGNKSNAFMIIQGQTMAHEGGHFLGLFHPEERSGAVSKKNTDPIPDTPECPASQDANRDGEVSAEECRNLGGSNLMFWTSAAPNSGIVQDQLTAGQLFVLQRNPLVRDP